MFFNRIRELNDLNRIWNSGQPQLVVIYGRRRVGKSALLSKWADRKPCFYWTATQTTGERLLGSFSRGLQTFKHPTMELSKEFSYPSWESAINEVADMARQKKMMLIIDELPYLIDADPEIPSLLQKMWDTLFQKSKIIMALTGSRIGMIEKHVLSSKGPLYGRASAVMWLDPLSVQHLHYFLPRYSQTQLVEVYSIAGGVPLYLKMFDDSISVIENIKREIQSTTSILKGEPYFLIHEELKEPLRFVAILEAIGSGKKQLSQISKTTGIEKPHLVPYLKILENIKFIKRNVTITENPTKSRKGLYDFSDLFLKFYFRFIAPYQNLLEEGRENSVIKNIEDQFDSFVGKEGFETLCRQWMIHMANQKKLPFDPETIGKYWDKSVEIDIAAVSKKHKAMMIGEAKWTHQKCGLNVLDELSRKGKHIEEKLDYHTTKFIFSKSGFSEPLIKRAKIENVRLIELKELFF